MKEVEPRAVRLRWSKIFRIIPSKFPPINFFERVVPAEQMEAAWYLEGLTNDRLRDETGDVTLVPEGQRVSGSGASVVMAAFTHIGLPSRFSDGSYGVYYAARTLETAVRETAYHRARFLAATAESAGEIDMRAYVGKPKEPLKDIRSDKFKALHDPDDYAPSQVFGNARREKGDWGLVYRSVRHEGGECIAVFKPKAVSIPVSGAALAYVWDGERITRVYEKSEVLFELD
ncbi:MAG TPA: RES family NAD+ phosphorylase [Steroidobacteraceae bacterium]|nr:RES family NAD+ phosphorylase [Steroidobacteraceae bacterium]